MDFLKSYPPVTYASDEEDFESYAPPIPIPAEESMIGIEVIQFLGTYPDEVTFGVVKERNHFELQVKNMMDKIHELEVKVHGLEKKNYNTGARLREARGMYQNEARVKRLWQEEYNRLVGMHEASVANSSINQPNPRLDNNGFIISNAFVGNQI